MRESVRLAVVTGVLLAGAGCAAWGQDAPAGAENKTTVVMPPTPLLPLRFAGYETARANAEGVATDATAQEFAGESCAPLPTNPPPTIPGAGTTCAAVLKEDGLIRFAAASYARAGGAPVQAFAFEFGDATGAYSAYTFYRSLEKGARVTAGDARQGKGSGETTSDAEGTLVWAGTAVLRVKGRLAGPELAALVAGLPKVGGRKGLAPLLPTLLPKESVEAGTVRYALGPAGYAAMHGVLPPNDLGWDKSLETATAAVAAKGRGGSGSGELTLMLYPTPQIAGDRGRAIEKMVNEGGGAAKFGTVKMRRVGPLVGMVSGGLGAEQAQGLVAGLHLNEEVSFDQKMPLEFHAEVQKTASLLENIAVLCGVLILAAVLLGLFLGGARAGMRVMMGKPAASEPEFLTINLRDEPKALFAERGEGHE